MAYDYELLRVEIDAGVCFTTIDNPPINLITPALYAELAAFAAEVEVDDSVRVVVLKSADPDFFLAHFDVEAILAFPIDTPAERDPVLNDYHVMCERFRCMGKATIAQIEGRVGGGGSELALSCDMRFGVKGRTKICQMEVPLGILPGGTGTQRLPRLIGRGRAMEVILGGDDLDAKTAEAWGYLNRALKAAEIGPFVAKLARRIASFPAEAVSLAKQSVDAAGLPLHEGLVEEAYLFQCLIRTEGAQRNMKRFLEIGGQTRKGELKVGALGARTAQMPKASRSKPEKAPKAKVGKKAAGKSAGRKRQKRAKP
jgi:enoyl-CoA hydratase/carnithine racemase